MACDFSPERVSEIGTTSISPGVASVYVPMNRVEALSVIRYAVEPDDVVCLMDTDVFLYGNLQEHLFPTGNAMARNWIISEERYFSFSTKGERGVSLPKLLEAMGCEQDFKPGA